MVIRNFLQEVFGEEVRINGRYPNSDRLPNTCNFSLLEGVLTGTVYVQSTSASVETVQPADTVNYNTSTSSSLLPGQRVLGALECSQASVGAACHSHFQAR